MIVAIKNGRDNKVHSVTIGENYVISPTTLNSARFAYNRTHISRPDIAFLFHSSGQRLIDLDFFLPQIRGRRCAKRPRR